MGAAIYGYASSRIYPVIVVGVLIGLVIRDPKQWRTQLSMICLMAVVSLVITGPLLVHYVEQPDQFWATARRNSINQPGDDGMTTFERNARDSDMSVPEVAVRYVLYTLQALVWGPVEGWYESPNGILAPLTASLSVLGLIIAIWKRQGRVVLIVMMWLVVFCAMSVVNWPIAAGQRLVGVLSVMALLVGLGAQALSQVQIPRLDRRILLLFVSLIVVGGGIQSTDYYFNDFLRSPAGAGDSGLQ